MKVLIKSSPRIGIVALVGAAVVLLVGLSACTDIFCDEVTPADIVISEMNVARVSTPVKIDPPSPE